MHEIPKSKTRMGAVALTPFGLRPPRAGALPHPCITMQNAWMIFSWPPSWWCWVPGPSSGGFGCGLASMARDAVDGGEVGVVVGSAFAGGYHVVDLVSSGSVADVADVLVSSEDAALRALPSRRERR